MVRPSDSLVHPRDEILQIMQRIYRYRMTTTSGGNISIREADGTTWITPARVDKGNLRRTDIVRVAPDGIVDGPHPPSSEFPFHKAIYAARPDLRGIVHAHPVALVAFSMVRQVPNTRLFHQAYHVCGAAGFAPYALPGSEQLGSHIAATFAQGYHCVLLENHGVVVGGETLQAAFERFETLEFTAKTIIKARHLGQVRYLDDRQVELPPRSLTPMPSFTRGPAGSHEKELRRQLAEFVRRGYQQRLLISTEGSFSARVCRDSFLITPYEVDRLAVEPADLVLIQEGAAESNKTASRAALIHQAIYARHERLGAVINAYPVNATAFSVTGAPFDARTIPESYLLLREVERVPYGLQFRAADELARRVAPHQPIALLDNDGVLVCGTDMLDAFDRLEVLEATAEASINSRLLGEVVPMGEGAIRELTAAFLKDG